MLLFLVLTQDLEEYHSLCSHLGHLQCGWPARQTADTRASAADDAAVGEVEESEKGNETLKVCLRWRLATSEAKAHSRSLKWKKPFHFWIQKGEK